MSTRCDDTLGLALPAGWERVPLEHDPFERFVRQLRQRLSQRRTLPPPACRRLELLVRQLRSDCISREVSLVAVYAIPHGPGPGGGGEPLAATCTLGVLERTALCIEPPLTVHTILAAVTRAPPSGASFADVSPPASVDLACGRAVQIVRVQALGAPSLPWLGAHYLVPYRRGERVALLSFATPNVEDAVPLTALFREVAQSLRLGDAADHHRAGGTRR